MLDEIKYILSISDKTIEGELSLSPDIAVHKIKMKLVQRIEAKSNHGKIIGRTEIDCGSQKEISFTFTVNPIPLKHNFLLSKKLQEVHDLIHIEASFYELRIIFETENEENVYDMPVYFSN